MTTLAFVNSSAFNIVLAVGLVVLVVLAVAAKMWQRRMLDRAVDNVQAAQTLGPDGMSILAERDKNMSELIAHLQTSVVFDAPIARVEQVLGSVRPPLLWTRDGSRRWESRGAALQDVVVLIENGTSARAEVAFSAGRDGTPLGGFDWKTFKKRMQKAAAKAGVPTREVNDGELVRVGSNWLRPGRDAEVG